VIKKKHTENKSKTSKENERRKGKQQVEIARESNFENNTIAFEF
jgi:hypothetical protein